eukprot:g4258.t1
MTSMTMSLADIWSAENEYETETISGRMSWRLPKSKSLSDFTIHVETCVRSGPDDESLQDLLDGRDNELRLLNVNIMKELSEMESVINQVDKKKKDKERKKKKKKGGAKKRKRTVMKEEKGPRTFRFTFNCHRSFLGAGAICCEYFRNLFASDGFQEADHCESTIKLSPTATRAFPAFLDFLYEYDRTGKFDLNDVNVIAMIQLADYFQCTLALKLAIKYAKKNLRHESCVIYLREAISHNLEPIVTQVFPVVVKHIYWNDFEKPLCLLEPETIQRILDCEDLPKYNPQQMSRIVMTYFSGRQSKVTPTLIKNFTHPRFMKHISPDVALDLLNLALKYSVDQHCHDGEGNYSIRDRCVDALESQFRQVNKMIKMEIAKIPSDLAIKLFRNALKQACRKKKRRMTTSPSREVLIACQRAFKQSFLETYKAPVESLFKDVNTNNEDSDGHQQPSQIENRNDDGTVEDASEDVTLNQFSQLYEKAYNEGMLHSLLEQFEQAFIQGHNYAANTKLTSKKTSNLQKKKRFAAETNNVRTGSTDTTAALSSSKDLPILDKRIQKSKLFALYSECQASEFERKIHAMKNKKSTETHNTESDNDLDIDSIAFDEVVRLLTNERDISETTEISDEEDNFL